MDCNTNPAAAQARSPAPPCADFLAYLQTKAQEGGILSYRDFVAAALYAPGLGYYTRQDRLRVGRNPNTDFYTASSLGDGVFGKLLRAAAVSLLSPEPANHFTLMELAAEADGGVFAPPPEPFRQLITRRLGENLMPPDHAVVFANEWLDAQPFHRFIFRQGQWRELGVKIAGSKLDECELPEFSPAARILQTELPTDTTESYHLDISLDAENALNELVASPWRGTLMLADYGYDWPELVHERPAGTARAYFRHQVSGDLLNQPGEQDLTCHVCWDRLEATLAKAGFSDIEVERQEAFFMRHSGSEIEHLLSEKPGQFSQTRQTLMELLHPAHLGSKFQILSARRL